jgi:hypothetical protein
LLPCICAVPLAAADPDPVETVEKAAAEWVKVRAETTRIQSEWTSQHALLESLVNGLTERAQTLETKRDYLTAKTAKDREELATLAATNQGAVTAISQVETQLKAVDARLLQLRPALPPRLSAALDLPYRSLAAKELTVSERMQYTMAILNRSTLFNRSITCEEELLTLDGKAQLVEAIYWGLSHGYALDRTTGRTWYGSPGPEGWHWEALPDATSAVTRLIAIYRSKAEPDFVAAPARLKTASASTSVSAAP